MKRGVTLLLVLACAGAAGAQDPVGQFGDWWNQSSLEAGRTYGTTLSVVNEDCAGYHDFEVSLDDEAKKYFRLQKDPVVRDLGEGTWGKVLVLIDLRQVPPGGYERGHFIIRCLNCPPKCHQTYRQLRATFAVSAVPGLPPAPGEHGEPLEKVPQVIDIGEPKPTHPNEPAKPEAPKPLGGFVAGNAGEPLEFSKKPAKRCGPDVTSAFLDAVRRLRRRVERLPAGERAGAGFDFWKRNFPWPLEKPDPPTCKPTGEACLGTVTLFEVCTASIVPEWMLEGLLKALLDPEEARARTRETLPPGAGADGELYKASFDFGVALADVTAEAAKGSASPSFAERALVAFRSVGAVPGMAFHSRWILCDTCGDPARFGEDCTLRDWRLAGGGVASPVE